MGDVAEGVEGEAAACETGDWGWESGGAARGRWL